MQTISTIGYKTLDEARAAAHKRRGRGITAKITKGEGGLYFVTIKKPGKPNFG